jgi:DNA-binding NarL/FixJ family response regulator
VIKVVIIDDHSLFRQGLKRLLESDQDFQVQADCGTVEQGLEALRSLPVDIVLLDFDLGLQRAFEFQTRARAERLDTPVLIVTAGLSQLDAGRAMALGARGVFVKHDSPEVLAAAIRRVVSGGEWLDPRYAQARNYAEKPAVSPEALESPAFTSREKQVLRGVLEGLSNKEIADALLVSEPSVKAALQRLFQKTGVRTRGQLVRASLEQFPDEV